MGGRGGGSSIAAKAPTPSAAPAAPTVAPAIPQLREGNEAAFFGAITTRAQGEEALKGLSGARLKAIADAVGMPRGGGRPSTKQELIIAIVEFTVGNRINSAAIRGL